MDIGGDERRERQAAREGQTARDNAPPAAPGTAADHEDSADMHARNAERLERLGAERAADRERDDAQRERDAAEDIRRHDDA
jgi:hypothetical protein